MSHIPLNGSIWAQMSEEVEKDEDKGSNIRRGEWRIAVCGIEA